VLISDCIHFHWIPYAVSITLHITVNRIFIVKSYIQKQNEIYMKSEVLIDYCFLASNTVWRGKLLHFQYCASKPNFSKLNLNFGNGVSCTLDVIGHTMTQAISHWLLIIEDQVQSQDGPCGIYGAQSGSITFYSPSTSTSVFFCHYHSTNAPCSLLPHTLTNWQHH
jgi:hypothetical protein